MADWFTSIKNNNFQRVQQIYLTSVGQINDLKQTGLILAAKNNHIEIVQLLAQYEKNITDIYGKKAINYAIELKYDNIIKVLSQYEIVNTQNQENKNVQSTEEILQNINQLRKEISTYKRQKLIRLIAAPLFCSILVFIIFYFQ